MCMYIKYTSQGILNDIDNVKRIQTQKVYECKINN